MNGLRRRLSRHLPLAVLDLIFPRRCAGCGRFGEWLCSDCRDALPAIGLPICGRCGRPGAAGPSCNRCKGTLTAIDGIRSAFVLTGPAWKAVHRLKYNGIVALAGPMGDLLADRLHRYPMPSDLLVPVPLHRRRLMARGDNQSAHLARRLGELTETPVLEALIRQRDTSSQVRVQTAASRQRNVAGAFACRADAIDEIRGRRVLLIDDVVTTGSTLDAGASALKSAGASAVWGLTFAREL